MASHDVDRTAILDPLIWILPFSQRIWKQRSQLQINENSLQNDTGWTRKEYSTHVQVSSEMP